MNQETKDEALEQLELDIKFGFENEDELFGSIRDMFYDEEDFDEEWLRHTISEKYNLRQQESLTWVKPTDFDRLAKAFDQLTQEKIICLHKAGYTKQDSISDCMETIERLNDRGINVIGFCYYHSQDLERVIDKDQRNLYVGFDSSKEDDKEALQVAQRIVATLKANNFEVNWPGTIDQRIEIKNINWQKVPDNEDWGANRVIRILTSLRDKGKPFWKFW
jgi:hypothetical protein